LCGGETFMRERIFGFGENRKWNELVDFKRVSHQVPLNSAEVQRAWRRVWSYSYEEASKQRREMMKEGGGLNRRHDVRAGVQTGE